MKKTTYFETIFRRKNWLTDTEYSVATKSYEADYGLFLPHDRDGLILDIGCGAGHFLWFLENKGYKRLVGVDSDLGQVRHCRGKVQARMELADAIDFLNHSQARFDLIAANDFIEHLTPELLEKLLQLILERLNPGGIFLTRTINLGNPLGVYARYGDFTHALGFTEWSLEQALLAAGFVEIAVFPSTRLFPSTFRGRCAKGLMPIADRVIRGLYRLYGYEPPRILSKLLIGVGKKKQ
jgi:SAM-dependent methyltransferase